ncbi:MAG: helix-turn-helix domain-containing protein [Rubrobacter sp.]|nr:helix-turn-helix domain-containing protein [Rubrobacter sp.]
MKEHPRFLTVPEAAHLLRINRGKAYSMAADGSLPGVVRIGPKSIRVDRERLLEGLAGASEDSCPSKDQNA